MEENKIVLHYVGTGSLISVPARDLTEQDLKNIEWTGWNKEKLVESKLYITVERLEQEEVLEEVYEQVTNKEIKQEQKDWDVLADTSKIVEKKQSKKRGK